MSFEAVWGFDPHRVIQAVGLPPSETEMDKFTYSAEEQRAARIPPDLHAQIYELRRMYRL
jgi:hypothetical protein